ncbi:nucleotidyltransferase domain-containing protein [Conexibacter sp. JD483]|uniref:nucleotidyltransferase domain-containing protein n=1 Tax=unclassified Conexibacter TaxID=2627773 RepID=UPI0027240634|nr:MULTISPECIES: nucleotidyltransferase domain-containing protein [unclassified Conexibacter]MDO8186898.1 nucleotidyltransferase domain-containing protein [Conexibacter sp. CPCC 205706]MDO8200790.1 nucleotidyltransferase domain-containing protein [Conexibacter sp. CPCC 205762]MDR9371972.1 nucleotidyltransferase domain-containing protein [Conexibacter sp. JD483]
MIDERTIALASSRLTAAIPDAARVYLFGSAARQQTGPDSDLDFLVIEPIVEDRAKEAVRLRRAIGDVGVPVDVIVLDSTTAASRANVPGTMVHHALTDGRLLDAG